MNIEEAIKTIKKATAKWHPCDKKVEALGVILQEVDRLTSELEEARQLSTQI